MKKIIIIFVVLPAVVGGLYFYNQRKKPAPAPVAEISGPIKGLRVIDDNSLTGWLKRKKTVECRVKAEDGQEIKILVKNDVVRVEGIPYFLGAGGSQTSGVSLTDGDWVYQWSGNEGVKINLAELHAGMSEEQRAKAADFSWEESAKKWTDEYEYECAEKKLSDELFAAPKEIEFKDMTSVLIGAQSAAQKALENLSPGQILNQEDIEALF